MTYETGQIIKIDLKTLESTILLEAKSHYDEETNTYNGEMFGDVGYIDHQGFVYSLERLKRDLVRIILVLGKLQYGIMILKLVKQLNFLIMGIM